MNSFLSVMHLSKSYGNDMVLKDVTLRFPATGFIAIVGPSGSGKSTLLSLLSGQILPDKGSVFAGEEELTALPEERRSSASRTSGWFSRKMSCSNARPRSITSFSRCLA